MSKLKPIALAVMGCGLLQACSAPPSHPLQVQPMVRGEQPGNHAASWNRLARFHHERGQLALALGAYAQSLALDANQLEARNAVAVIEAQQGDLEAARRALSALVNDYPGEAQPHTNLGYVQHLMGDHAGAAQTLRRAMALGAGPKAFQNLQLAEAAMQAKPDPAAPQMAAASTEPPAVPAPAPFAAAAPAPAVPPAAVPAMAAPPAPAPALAAAPEAAPAPAAVVAAPAAPAPAAAPVIAAQAMPAPAPARAAAPLLAPPAVQAPQAATPARPSAPLLAAAPAPVLAPLAVAQLAVPAAPAEPAAAPRQAPAALSALPAKAYEIGSRMELIQVSSNVFDLRMRVEAPPAPAVPAVAAKPAVQAVAQASKVRMARLEVSNGNGVNGMARRFRSMLGQLGIPVNRLSNDKPYRQVATTIQYSPGFEKQAASLQKALQGKVQLASRQLRSSDVRLVLGRDAQLSLTAASEAAGLTLLAMHDEDAGN